MFRNRALITAITTAMICLAAATKADQILYCTDELATGFIKERGGWRTVNVIPERFTLKVEGDFETLIHSGNRYSCLELWMAFGVSRVSCNEDYYGAFSIIMDKNSLRYVRTYPADDGFVSSKENDFATDVTYAGTCETF